MGSLAVSCSHVVSVAFNVTLRSLYEFTTDAFLTLHVHFVVTRARSMGQFHHKARVLWIIVGHNSTRSAREPLC